MNMKVTITEQPNRTYSYSEAILEYGIYERLDHSGIYNKYLIVGALGISRVTQSGDLVDAVRPHDMSGKTSCTRYRKLQNATVSVLFTN